MKSFVYLLIFLLAALLFQNIFKKLNIIEGLECAPKENSQTYNNQAKAKYLQNEIESLMQKIKGFKPQIQKNSNKIEESKELIQKATKSIHKKTKAKSAEMDKVGGM